MVHHPIKNTLFEYKLIGDIAKEHPGISDLMERYFGRECLKKLGFKIQTFEMACILADVNQNRLIQDL